MSDVQVKPKNKTKNKTGNQSQSQPFTNSDASSSVSSDVISDRGQWNKQEKQNQKKQEQEHKEFQALLAKPPVQVVIKLLELAQTYDQPYRNMSDLFDRFLEIALLLVARAKAGTRAEEIRARKREAAFWRTYSCIEFREGNGNGNGNGNGSSCFTYASIARVFASRNGQAVQRID